MFITLILIWWCLGVCDYLPCLFSLQGPSTVQHTSCSDHQHPGSLQLLVSNMAWGSVESSGLEVITNIKIGISSWINVMSCGKTQAE